MSHVTIAGLVHERNTVLIKEQDVKKEELIKKLAGLACEGMHPADTEEILARVLKREKGITTTLDTGLGIPHCRAEEVDSFKAAVAVIPGGIKDPAAGNTDIKIMFLFISPANSAFFQQHLQLLAQLSEKFKDDFINALSGAASARDALKIIRQ